MKRRHLERNFHSSSKRPLNTNKYFHLSSQKVYNQNQHSYSSHSLTCYLKEYNLSKKDLVELRQALQQISHYFQSKKIYDHQQRLISPYLQQQEQFLVDNQSLLPLYTNEYFIRNGLLNHNDGPEIYDEIFSSKNQCHTPVLSCSPSSPSSMNVSLPLVLLPNQKHLFTALTSNFALNQPRCSQSIIRLTTSKDNVNIIDNEIETESMIIRRNKVQTWERENVLQRKLSINNSFIKENDPRNILEYHRNSIIRTVSNKYNRNSMIITETPIIKTASSLKTSNREEDDVDNLFPMMKKLAPYIIIRNSIDRHCKEKKSLQQSSDVLHCTLETNRGRSLLLPCSSAVQQINNDEQVHRRKKNHLLAEFDSVLTPIVKR